MADSIPILRYGVFTDTPYTGNPLAVAIEPPPMTDEAHQRVAGELNLSETVFLRRRSGGDGWDTRIFTPGSELPFAGHPTVGAAVALADAGLVDDRVVLHEGVGPVTVRLADGVATLTTAVAPHALDVADPGDVAACLGLDISDLHPSLGPRGWSAGLAFTVVAVRDVDVLARVDLDPAAWRDGVGRSPARELPAQELYVVAPLEGLDGGRWRARMFAPALGIVEDPATGSAAAALCGYLAGHVRPSRLAEGWVIEQGVEMGRPSRIELGAVIDGNQLVAATVGGRAVLVGSGHLLPPDPAP